MCIHTSRRIHAPLLLHHSPLELCPWRIDKPNDELLRNA
jgi:hypothetical protein